MAKGSHSEQSPFESQAAKFAKRMHNVSLKAQIKECEEQAQTFKAVTEKAQKATRAARLEFLRSVFTVYCLAVERGESVYSISVRTIKGTHPLVSLIRALGKKGGARISYDKASRYAKALQFAGQQADSVNATIEVLEKLGIQKCVEAFREQQKPTSLGSHSDQNKASAESNPRSEYGDGKRPRGGLRKKGRENEKTHSKAAASSAGAESSEDLSDSESDSEEAPLTNPFPAQFKRRVKMQLWAIPCDAHFLIYGRKSSTGIFKLSRVVRRKK